MSTSTQTLDAPVGVHRNRKVALIGCAVAFTVLYLSVDIVGSPLAKTTLPLPNDPVADTRAWFDANALAATVMAVLQALSATALLLYASALARCATTGPQRSAIGRARPWALLAAALMYASCVLSGVLVTIGSSASLDTVSVVRTANFIAGGTAHVLALALFVWFAARAPWFGRGHRILAGAVLVAGVLSVSSVVVLQGGVFVLAGRLLGMIWTIAAGVSVARGRRGRARDTHV